MTRSARPPRPPRLVALDLDGTALTDAKRLAPGLTRAVASLRAAGVETILLSGRLLPSVRHFAEQLELAAPCGAMNGVLVRGATEVVHDAPLACDVADALVDRAAAHGVFATLFLQEAIVLPPAALPFRRMLDNFGDRADYRVRDNVRPGDCEAVYQVHYLGPPAALERLARDLLAAGLCDPAGFFGYGSVESTHHHLEYKSPEDKGSALRRIRARLGIEREETVMVGDWINDLPAFAEAGFRVAVGNAEPEVRAAADAVVPGSNNDDSLARFLLSLLDLP